MERQNVNMTKMLDPTARWPTYRESDGRDKMIGLEVLDLAKLTTTRDHTRRPGIIQVLYSVRCTYVSFNSVVVVFEDSAPADFNYC